MSDPKGSNDADDVGDSPSDSPPDSPSESNESDAMRALLKRSLGTESEQPLLRGVQKKIRRRSRGKFYADGWSTTDAKVSYALVAIVMLALIAFVYFVLGPTGIAPG